MKKSLLVVTILFVVTLFSTATATSVVVKDPAAVPVHLFIMSKCNVSAAFEQLFLPVLESYRSIIDLQIDYIADLDASAPLGVRSDYGLPDVEGDMWELCTYAAASDMLQAYKVMLCMNEEQSLIPANAADCVDKILYVPKEMDRIKACAVADPSSEGVTLLKKSIAVTTQYQASWAPVIWIGGKQWCIWGTSSCPFHGADDVERAICNAYKGSQPLCK
jgi:hypothetical protein